MFEGASCVIGRGSRDARVVFVGEVPGIDDEEFQEIAEAAKNGCPVSKALAGP